MIKLLTPLSLPLLFRHICFFDSDGYFYYPDFDPITGNMKGDWEHPSSNAYGSLFGTFSSSTGGFTFACLSAYNHNFIVQGVFYGNGSDVRWENPYGVSGFATIFLCGHSLEGSNDPANSPRDRK